MDITFIEFIRYILAVVLGFFGICFIYVNWAVLFAWIIKRRSTSRIPFLGGFLLCAGFAIFPNNPYIRFFWIAPLIDISIFGLVIGIPIVIVRDILVKPSDRERKYLEKRISLSDDDPKKERKRLSLRLELFNSCTGRSLKAKKFSEYLSWDDFHAQFFNRGGLFMFAYKDYLLLISANDNPGYCYILERREYEIEKKNFSFKQELLDNIRIEGKMLQEIWDDLK